MPTPVRSTPIVTIAAVADETTLRLLLSMDASTVLADREGRTPLRLARDRGHAAMVRLLEAAGAH